MWGKKKEKEGTADRQLSKRELREMQKKNVDEIEKVTFTSIISRRRLKQDYISVFIRRFCLEIYILYSVLLSSEEQWLLTEWLACDDGIGLWS